VLYVLAYAALAWMFAGHPTAQAIYGNLGILLPPLALCLVILRRRSQWLGHQRLFWDAFFAGMVLWMLGHLGWAYGEWRVERPAWVQWHTIFSLCGGMGPLVALIARPHRGARESTSGATAVDLVSYATLGAFIYAYFVVVPSFVPSNGSNSEELLLTLVQVHRFLILAGTLIAAWFARRTSWASTYQRIVFGLALGFFFRLSTNAAIASGAYHIGSLFDLAWIVPFLCNLWAALEAPVSTRTSELRLETPLEHHAAWMSAVPVLLVPLIGYGFLRLQPLGDPGDAFRILLTTMTTVGGVGLLTLRLAVQNNELQRADARLKLLAAATEQTGDLILITRGDGTYEHANDACLRALGYTRAEMEGLNLAELLEHGAAEKLRDHIGREVRSKGVWRGTLVHRRRDGSSFPVASTVAALRDSTGKLTHFVGVQRDITEELRLRDQLVHSERMSAVGELVAGVAHEINNPLQTIVGCVELLLEEHGSPEDQQRDLKLVRQEAARAGQIVRNLLAFVRKGSPDRVTGDLNQIVRSTVDLREYHLTLQNISLLADLQPGALPILANREEIQQVVLNLLLNAEQAIVEGPGSGSIVVRTRSDGRFHTLQVTDDGPGIESDLQGRIFEPFFTTKEVGQGTGLGLSISLGIATSHGGSLMLCSPEQGRKETQGACFQLSLPAVEPAAVAPRPPKILHAGSNGGPRALVVEDEAPIRSLLVRLLVRRGFHVTEAASVNDALRRVEATPFEVVLCDVALGDTSGIDCFRAACRIRPELTRRFVFVTGDAGTVWSHADAAEVPVLAKPFTVGDLDRALGDVGAVEA
jgi:PAS domain S-box-containing protein